MTRSFSYAAEAARRNFLRNHPATEINCRQFLANWQKWSAESFIEGYFAETADCPSITGSTEEFRKILSLLCVEKAVYELNYELNNRPDWLEIPLNGLVEALELK
jgi:maltose alpha-D-glucosyltransferase/alpha-amylase